MLHTNKQTNKQINAGKNIYLLAEVKYELTLTPNILYINNRMVMNISTV